MSIALFKLCIPLYRQGRAKALLDGKCPHLVAPLKDVRPEDIPNGNLKSIKLQENFVRTGKT